MKYYLFGGYSYYPSGGAEDFRGEFSSIELAQKHAHEILPELDNPNSQWAHITNDKLRIVSEYDCNLWDNNIKQPNAWVNK